nr:hypothetical protein CFP56_33121 [Quercus suber]
MLWMLKQVSDFLPSFRSSTSPFFFCLTKFKCAKPFFVKKNLLQEHVKLLESVHLYWKDVVMELLLLVSSNEKRC